MASDAASLKLATKNVLQEIAKHALALATGLQNAAPPLETGPNKSVQYLLEISEYLEKTSQTIDAPSGEL